MQLPPDIAVESSSLHVLFVHSANGRSADAVIQTQVDCLRRAGVCVSLFAVHGKGIVGYLKNVPRLRQWLRSHSVDVVHAHYGLCGIVAALAGARRRLVVSFMGNDLEGTVDTAGRREFRGRVLRFLNQLFARFVYLESITKSRSLQRQLWRGTEGRVIPNGVNLDTFHPMDVETARNTARLSSTRRIVLFAADPKRPEKNVALARQAVALLDDPEVDLSVIHSVSHREMNAYYNAADVLLLTSWCEGSPNVIKEAMACNCPIVSTDVGDVREVIGATAGCYLTATDPRDVAAKLQMALRFGGRTQGRQQILQLNDHSTALALRHVYKEITRRGATAHAPRRFSIPHNRRKAS